MYAVLTGLNPFYDAETTKAVIKKVRKGEKAYIDPRWKESSPAEAALAEIIPRCFEYDPQSRISIFEIVDHLTQAVHTVLQDGMTRESILDGIKTDTT